MIQITDTLHLAKLRRTPDLFDGYRILVRNERASDNRGVMGGKAEHVDAISERALAAAQFLDDAGLEAAFEAAALRICSMTRPRVRKAAQICSSVGVVSDIGLQSTCTREDERSAQQDRAAETMRTPNVLPAWPPRNRSRVRARKPLSKWRLQVPVVSLRRPRYASGQKGLLHVETASWQYCQNT